MERAAETMRRLQALGVRHRHRRLWDGIFLLTAILPRLPFNVLKIDRSFVKELDLKPEMKSMVQCLITLAHNLNMQVVVEGIETPQQLEMVKGFGGNQAQGFFLGRPTSDPTCIATDREDQACASCERRLECLISLDTLKFDPSLADKLSVGPRVERGFNDMANSDHNITGHLRFAFCSAHRFTVQTNQSRLASCSMG